ncbi:LPXTG cell wall anchor domain-containing protein [Enterococcus faecalis]|uniref:LPXTG cell wall anchor domain-containing protein n=1 Tax=Enterococcus faecalis TaxID=1351 RepID=UPI002DBD3D00|nr:LPXTG cell wall anchor domain-containing protein [Enterococcus faecalis]MEB7792124.1 LPXTG cell wall anchor domain-containing protein [Enterococcus faecalis]MEB7810089.1 LPXTG cell wall anchor domain-containing protein [Enterococcus faecalis]
MSIFFLFLFLIPFIESKTVQAADSFHSDATITLKGSVPIPRNDQLIEIPYDTMENVDSDFGILPNTGAEELQAVFSIIGVELILLVLLLIQKDRKRIRSKVYE